MDAHSLSASRKSRRATWISRARARAESVSPEVLAALPNWAYRAGVTRTWSGLLNWRLGGGGFMPKTVVPMASVVTLPNLSAQVPAQPVGCSGALAGQAA